MKRRLAGGRNPGYDRSFIGTGTRIRSGPLITMSRLAHLQAALARLYTDAAARAELRHAPGEFAARHGLDEKEVAEIAREVLGEVDDFAQALKRKRFSEAARSMPLARELLGGRFDSLFDEFAALTPTRSARNPALDALAFERWLLAGNRAALPSAESDTLRYELAWLTMQHTNRRILVRWLLPPRSTGGSRAPVVWWRWRGRLRHWVVG